MSLEYAMYTTLLLVGGAALLRGGRAERLIALIMIATFVVQFIPTWRMALTGSGSWYHSKTTLLTIDIFQLAALAAVAITSRPLWTLFTAAFQLLATLISFIHVTEGISVTAYVSAQNSLWWLTMASLAFGVWQKAKGAVPAGTAPHILDRQPRQR